MPRSFARSCCHLRPDCSANLPLQCRCSIVRHRLFGVHRHPLRLVARATAVCPLPLHCHPLGACTFKGLPPPSFCGAPPLFLLWLRASFCALWRRRFLVPFHLSEWALHRCCCGLYIITSSCEPSPSFPSFTIPRRLTKQRPFPLRLSSLSLFPRLDSLLPRRLLHAVAPTSSSPFLATSHAIRNHGFGWFEGRQARDQRCPHLLVCAASSSTGPSVSPPRLVSCSSVTIRVCSVRSTRSRHGSNSSRRLTHDQVPTRAPPRPPRFFKVSSLVSTSLAALSAPFPCSTLVTCSVRRANIWIGSIIMAVGAIGCAASFSLAQLFVFRVILGIGNGMHTATIPVWQSECSPPHKRGMLIMVEGAMITGGIAMAYWIDFGCFFLEPSQASWRLPLALQLILIIPTFVTAFLPESPRWLMLKGRERRRESSLPLSTMFPSTIPWSARSSRRSPSRSSRQDHPHLGSLHQRPRTQLPPHGAWLRQPDVPADFRYQPHHLLHRQDAPEKPRFLGSQFAYPGRCQRNRVLPCIVACRLLH